MNNFNDDFVLNGCIFKCDTPNQYVLIDENGYIEGLTEGMSDLIYSEMKNADSKFQVFSQINSWIYNKLI